MVLEMFSNLENEPKTHYYNSLSRYIRESRLLWPISWIAKAIVSISYKWIIASGTVAFWNGQQCGYEFWEAWLEVMLGVVLTTTNIHYSVDNKAMTGYHIKYKSNVWWCILNHTKCFPAMGLCGDRPGIPACVEHACEEPLEDSNLEVSNTSVIVIKFKLSIMWGTPESQDYILAAIIQ